MFESFLKWEGEGFERIRRDKIPPNHPFLDPPNWGHLKRERKRVVQLILKRFKSSSLSLGCQFILISLKLINEDHNGQFI